MAQTTWKQVVYDAADAYREASKTTDKIPVGQLANLIRQGAGGEDVTAEVTEYETLLETAIANLAGKAFQPPIDPASDPDLIPENIREGVDIWGVIGTMSEGVSGIDIGEITLTANGAVTINHNLKKTPSEAYLIPKEYKSLAGGAYSNQTYANFNGTIIFSGFGGSAFQAIIEEGNVNTMTAETVTFGMRGTPGFIAGSYIWLVK